MRQRRSLFLVLALVLLLIAFWSTLSLVTPKQQSLEQRTHNVAAQLKCPVCQNESVADSSADLAQQMRANIRLQLQAGKSEQEVLAFYRSRYGSDIVLSPAWQGLSLLAWLVPILLFVLGGSLIFFVLRDWQRVAPVVKNPELKAEEEPGLAGYRAQLEQELAAEDILFRRSGKQV
ncbi:cytochrome c-type biogenesis protein [Tengunoibacter tsumagoiensis]|uniref:Cytochrome c-type biogenesis protein n=1 Tax=Tengunoibacter tsumagoiensis TaxID=2014871 RepID=A0A402A5G2_9CHLR|nr:cytochrome c-type biogenesis protein [Tengunoibacter tsumagoiensis]GCE14377.1 cytochrome c biogenesis protein [Tengunoibacter tsumagoiensis]